MKFWQKILNSITFGLYNPEKKFEQEVLGEATTNLEEIENSRTDVEKAVAEYDKYFPNETNKFNNYELYESISNIDIDRSKGDIVNKNNTIKEVIKSEEKLQEQGKYVGMDEETRIKAVLAEGKAAKNAEWLSIDGKTNGEIVSKDMLEAFKISRYQAYMNDEEISGDGSNFNEFLRGDGSTIEKIITGVTRGPRIIGNAIQGTLYTGWTPDVEKMENQANSEKYVAMIIANDKATRQNDGTHSTKTAEEWAKIDEKREKELRDMPKEELFAQGQALEESLQARYAELTENREGNER